MPEGLADVERTAALDLIADLDDTSAQIVLDEWAGALVAGVIHTSSIFYLKTLVMRYCSGDMTLRYARSRRSQITSEDDHHSVISGTVSGGE